MPKKNGNKWSNKRCNPQNTKKIEYKIEIENEEKLKKRVAILDKKKVIKDDEKNKLLFFNATVYRKRIKQWQDTTKRQKNKQ